MKKHVSLLIIAFFGYSLHGYQVSQKNMLVRGSRVENQAVRSLHQKIVPSQKRKLANIQREITILKKQKAQGNVPSSSQLQHVRMLISKLRNQTQLQLSEAESRMKELKDKEMKSNLRVTIAQYKDVLNELHKKQKEIDKLT